MAKLENKEIIEKVSALIERSVAGQVQWRERAKQARRFYRGEQWSEEDKRTLDAASRPALTINHVLPTVNQLSGVQRQAKKDQQARPRRGGSARAAAIISALVKHTCDESHYEYEAADQFTEGIITAKGWLWLRPEFNDDPEHGNLRITSEPALYVFEDPSCNKYDHSAFGKYVVVAVREDKDEIEAEVPEDQWKNLGYGTGYAEATAGEKLASSLIESQIGNPEDEEDNDWTESRYLVYHAYWRQPTRKAEVHDADGQDGEQTRPLTGLAEIRRVKKLIKRWDSETAAPGRFRLENERTGSVLHYARVCGNVVLEYAEDPFNGIERLPVVRFTPFWDADNSQAYGLVENLVGPQEEENKRRSQELHHLNQSANSGWQYPDGSLTPEEEANTREFGSKPGFMQKYNAKLGKPERIQPMTISQAHLTLAEQARRDIQEISGVNSESLGYQAKGGTSGRALLLQQRQGQTTTEIVFDQFDRTQQVVGELIVDFIQKMGLYSDEEMRAILDDQDLVDTKTLAEAEKAMGPAPTPPQPLAPEMEYLKPQDAVMVREHFMASVEAWKAALEQYNEELNRRARELMYAEIANIRTGRYSCRVVQSANAPTQRLAQFYELLEIEKIRPGVIPVDVLIQATDLPDKDEIVARLREAQQNAPPLALPAGRPQRRGVPSSRPAAALGAAAGQPGGIP